MTDTWQHRAACRGLNPNLFHPERGDKDGVTTAKAICADCDVRAECLQYAIDTDQQLGIWGGLTRGALQIARRGRPPAPIEHGTDRGYHAHRRNDTDPCPACKRAHADYGNTAA